MSLLFANEVSTFPVIMRLPNHAIFALLFLGVGRVASVTIANKKSYENLLYLFKIVTPLYSFSLIWADNHFQPSVKLSEM